MSHIRLTMIGAGLMATAGCSFNQNFPIIFGQSITAGIAVSGGLPEQGAELTMGFTDRSFAIIPVSVTDTAGVPNMLGSKRIDDKEDWDALSVFGHFSSTASASKPTEQQNEGSTTQTKGAKPVRATLGKFFATGLAAQHLASGFAEGMGFSKPAAQTSPLSAAEKAEKAAKDHAVAAAKSAQEAAASAQGARNIAHSPAVNEPKSAYLIFGQYDVYGLSLNGSSADLGGGLSLGFRSRNIAIVPTTKLFKNGNYQEMLNSSGKSGTEFDSLSVLGQFKANADGGLGLDAGLDMFFSTGSAARYLGEGLGARAKTELLKQSAAEGTPKEAAKPPAKPAVDSASGKK